MAASIDVQDVLIDEGDCAIAEGCVGGAGMRRLPSLASPLWREECVRAMREFVRWLIRSGWSRHGGAFLVSYGITWEWAIPGTDGLPDYSPHTVRYFREFLRKKYGSDDALSEAWGRPARIDEAEIPGCERRERAGGEAGLRSIPEEQDVIDHQHQWTGGGGGGVGVSHVE